MATIMTKRGSQDNILTYEHMCDTAADMAAIDSKYITLGSVCIVLGSESGELEVFIANSNKQWMPITSIMGGGNGNNSSLGIEVVSANSNTGLPNVAEPSESVIYLVADGDEANNLYKEYVYINNAWEMIGGGSSGMTEQEVAAAFAQHYGTEVCYTLAIDETNSSPGNACTYQDDAYGMTKGSAQWDTMPIFKDIKPCVFKNGKVVYYLNPKNWDKKEDGTASVLTGADGDVMIEFPKFAYRIYRNGSTVYVSITNDMWLAAVDHRFNLDAFSRITVGDLDHFYQGAYQGYVDANNKLRSIVGVLPTNGRTITAFRTAAQANGAHYQQNVYSHLKALQCLYLIKYGNRDGQTALGMGNVSGNNAVLLNGYNVKKGGTMNNTTSTAKLGMCFGDTSIKTKHMRFFGIEDFWGNLSDWIDGLTTDSNGRILINSDYSGESNVQLKDFISGWGLPDNFNNYPKKIRGNSIEGFIPSLDGGSQTSYWPDYADLYASCALCFGGDNTANQNAGPFSLDIVSSATYYGSDAGARLTFH